MKDFKLNSKDAKFIYDYHIRNEAFNIMHRIQSLQGLYQQVVKNKSVLLDPYIGISTQLRLCMVEANNLIKAVDRISDDFVSDEEKAETKKRLGF